MRNETKELIKELGELKQSVSNHDNFGEQKDLKALRDDVQFFTAENLELRLKIKSLVMQNMEQKQKISELDHIARSVRRISGGSAFNFNTKGELSDEKVFMNLSAISATTPN